MWMITHSGFVSTHETKEKCDEHVNVAYDVCEWCSATVCPEYTRDDIYSKQICRPSVAHVFGMFLAEKNFRWINFLWIRRFGRDKIMFFFSIFFIYIFRIHFEWTILKNPPWLQFFWSYLISLLGNDDSGFFFFLLYDRTNCTCVFGCVNIVPYCIQTVCDIINGYR